MRWDNLKKNKCPQCNKGLTKDARKVVIKDEEALRHTCGFTIRVTRMTQIIAGKINEEINRPGGIKEDGL